MAAACACASWRMTDELTGVPNRRAVLARLDPVLSNAAHPPCSILIIDIDHFKNINDHHGHVAGDQVLKVVADQRALGSDGAGLLRTTGWGGIPHRAARASCSSPRRRWPRRFVKASCRSIQDVGLRTAAASRPASASQLRAQVATP